MAVFGSSTGAPKILKADKAILSVDGYTVIGLNVQIQFARQVERVPTIGETDVMSVSKPSGTISIGTLVATGNDAMDAFHLNDDGCHPFPITLDLNNGTCDTSAGTSITAYGCIASAVTLEAQGGRGYIAHGVQVTFTGMDM